MRNLASNVPDIGARAGDPFPHASEVARYLEPAVQDLVALSVNAKQAHWHVRGHNFIAVHEYLDVVYTNASDAADLLAERVIAVGEPVDARLSEVASRSNTPELTEGFQDSAATITQVIEQLDAVRQTVLRAVKALEEADPVSHDLAVSVAQTLDKDRWFLSAQLG